MEDYSEFQDLDDDSTMTQLTKLARAQVQAEAAVEEAQRQLDIRKKELEDIAEQQLPDLMRSVGVEEFTTTEGRKISVKEKVRASIPIATQQEAFEWLRDTGNAKMIKRNIGVQLAMGQDQLADEIKLVLAERELDVTDKQAVHPSTLSAFCKRRLEAGEELPLDVITVHRQRVAKVS